MKRKVEKKPRRVSTCAWTLGILISTPIGTHAGVTTLHNQQSAWPWENGYSIVPFELHGTIHALGPTPGWGTAYENGIVISVYGNADGAKNAIDVIEGTCMWDGRRAKIESNPFNANIYVSTAEAPHYGATNIDCSMKLILRTNSPIKTASMLWSKWNWSMGNFDGSLTGTLGGHTESLAPNALARWEVATGTGDAWSAQMTYPDSVTMKGTGGGGVELLHYECGGGPCGAIGYTMTCEGDACAWLKTDGAGLRGESGRLLPGETIHLHLKEAANKGLTDGAVKIETMML